ncbi:MAG TPA: hypothetical protein VEW68_09405 [Patescibacteria group bacterium]|nr:hypothetical protein [Patescibacteria group bacterium]
MDVASEKRRTPWGFWAACVVAVAGGITPTLLAGTGGRVSGVIYTFWFGALAMAGCALFEHRGRFLTTVLYLAGSLAIVYGILGMVAVLLQMTVLTPCPPAPATCEVGYSRPLSSSENTGLDYAMGLGFLAVGFGFTGMVANYRRYRNRKPVQSAPPVRRIEPAPEHQPEPPAAAEPESTTATEGAPE